MKGHKMRSRVVHRIGAATAALAAAMLVNAPGASANWSSYISEWGPYSESRRWTDESYSEVRFANCYGADEVMDWTEVRLRRVVDNVPDVNYGTKTYTNCFNYIEGSDSHYVSAGAWTGLPYSAATYEGGEYKGGYYFDTPHMDATGPLNVETVYQDTTQAD
ncbi:hypothetical protein [Streptomyces sp. 2A115]|uniref:hypothetical protein n=1 Tax=Streptomyces sp. 2A115 TaxID=3457439 RepID=UPI003FD42342